MHPFLKAFWKSCNLGTDVGPSGKTSEETHTSLTTHWACDWRPQWAVLLELCSGAQLAYASSLPLLPHFSNSLSGTHAHTGLEVAAIFILACGARGLLSYLHITYHTPLSVWNWDKTRTRYDKRMRMLGLWLLVLLRITFGRISYRNNRFIILMDTGKWGELTAGTRRALHLTKGKGNSSASWDNGKRLLGRIWWCFLISGHVTVDLIWLSWSDSAQISGSLIPRHIRKHKEYEPCGYIGKSVGWVSVCWERVWTRLRHRQTFSTDPWLQRYRDSSVITRRLLLGRNTATFLPFGCLKSITTWERKITGLNTYTSGAK